MAALKVALVDPNPAGRRTLAIKLSSLEGVQLAYSTNCIVNAAAQHAALGSPPDLIILQAGDKSWDHPRTWMLLRALFPNSRCLAIVPSDRSRALQWGFIYGCTLIENDKEAAAWLGRHLRCDLGPSLSSEAAAGLGRLLMFPARNAEATCGDASGSFLPGIPLPCQAVRLSALERKVLAVLVERSPSAVTAEDLLRLAWSSPKEAGRTGDQVYGCIRRLRKKIEKEPRRPQTVRTVRGQGYCIDVRVKPGED